MVCAGRCPEENCAMSKRSSIKSKRRSKALPALGLAGVSFSLASGACASTSEATANTLSTSQSQTHELLLGEEEIFDVSLATFYIYDKENAGPSGLPQNLKLARGGCGGCGGGAVAAAAEVAVVVAAGAAAAEAAFISAVVVVAM